MNRFSNIFVALSFVFTLSACGGGYSGFLVPADTALNPFEAPEADDLVAEEAEEEVEADYEDYEDEEGVDGTTPAATPAEATPAAVK